MKAGCELDSWDKCIVSFPCASWDVLSIVPPQPQQGHHTADAEFFGLHLPTAASPGWVVGDQGAELEVTH